jgi:LacI family transcriptional regulator
MSPIDGTICGTLEPIAAGDLSLFTRPRVALLIETSLVYGRRILRGITRHIHSHGPWSVYLEQREDQAPLPAWLESWRGDGVICRMTNVRLAEALTRTRIPIVDLNDYMDLGLPGVWSDHAAISRLAAEHLLDRGFRQFAFCGFSGQLWSTRRRDGFVNFFHPLGRPCSVYESRWSRRRSRTWEQERRKLLGWLKSLPKPVGIMACNDMRGQHVLDACRAAEIEVPEEIAVVGVDNDQLLCDLCDPPLSSVVPNVERIGYEAASLLDQLMNKKKTERQQWLIEPLGVSTRQSTDVLAVDDPNIAAALKMIRKSACQGVTVQEVVDRVAVSRSMLERGFHRHVGRTPQAEIRHVQINRVKELLAQTDLSLADVAERAGFHHPEYLSFAFKRETGETPGQFRRKARIPG